MIWKSICYLLACALVGTWIGIVTAAPAESATVRMYTPGGAPCGDACTYEWAVEQFGVPEGEPARMVIPAGSFVTQMSYAKDGVPYSMTDSAVLAEDEPGIGYYFERDGATFMMVRLDVCGNWAVMTPPAVVITPLAPTPIYTTFITPPPTTPWTPPPWTPVCVGCGPNPPPPPPPPPPCCEPPPPPSPVPMPASVLLLGGAVAGLTLFKRRRSS